MKTRGSAVPDKDIDFTKFTTFDIPDSLLIIGQSEKPQYSQSDNALALIQAFRTNMEKLGYIYTPSNPDADLGIQLTYMIKTERYVQYYNDPYWWLDYPGYWSPGFLAPFEASPPCPRFSKAIPIGIFTAFTTMETIATTKPVVFYEN